MDTGLKPSYLRRWQQVHDGAGPKHERYRPQYDFRGNPADPMQVCANAFRKFTRPAACPGGTNGHSPAIHRWGWAGLRHESRRDERRLGIIEFTVFGKPAGSLPAAQPILPAR